MKRIQKTIYSAKDELNGDHIIEFVSGGPKNYAYRTERKDRVQGARIHPECSRHGDLKL